MKRRLLLSSVCLLFASSLMAETLKTTYNPFTGKLDYITKLDSTTLPSGSGNYIQNTMTPTTGTQLFNVKQGKFSVDGFIMTDSNSCTWGVTINTLGALITALLNCPATGFVVLEDGTFMLQEDGSKIQVE